MIETPVRSSFAPATRAARSGAFTSSTRVGSALAKRWSPRRCRGSGSPYGVRHTGVVEHSARHHVLVVVVRRLVTFPVAVERTHVRPVRWSVVVEPLGESRDIVIAMPPTKGLV
jgi:hypothetical protein